MPGAEGSIWPPRLMRGTSANAEPMAGKAFTPSELRSLLAGALLAALALDLVFYPGTLEDAFITYRYSEHLGAGHGFGAWNIDGERVEGYTSYLWMLLLAGSSWSGVDVRTVSKVFGVLAHMALASLFILFPLLRREDPAESDPEFADDGVVVAGVFLALYLPLSFYATSGMETVAFATLVGFYFIAIYLPWRPWLFPTVGVLLILTRPEGVLIAAAGTTVAWLQARREKLFPSHVCLAAGLVVLTASALLLHRFALFGAFVPNTYLAKAAGGGLRHMALGLDYVGRWSLTHAVIIFFIFRALRRLAPPAAASRPRLSAVRLDGICVLLLIAAFMTYVVKVGGDNDYAFPFWRHFVHISPLFALLLGRGLVSIWPGRPRILLWTVFSVAALTNLMVFWAQHDMLELPMRPAFQGYPVFRHAPHNPYYAWLKDAVDQNVTIASGLGGELPYVIDALHIDLLGLNTRQVAQQGSFDPDGPQDSKTNMQWVLAQRPHVIEAYVSGKRIRSGLPAEVILGVWRRKMVTELVSSPEFQEHYMFVWNAPYEHLDRALFFRREYCQNHPQVNELGCVAVADTSLSGYAAHRH